MEPKLLDAIGDYLHAHVQERGHARTAAAFGVSRHTLWRFLERGQPGRSLPRAVTSNVGDTPEAVAAASRALAGDPRPSQPQQRAGPSLPRRLRETLWALCEAPFASVDELSHFNRVPASTLRGRLAQLRERGLADARPHRLAALGGRPQQRYFPTAAGVAALRDTTPDDVPRLYPVSRQWFRLLTERLDSVALIYAVAARVAEADPDKEPVRVDHYRQGPYDALITLSGGRSLGVVRQGPMLTAASLRYRLRTIERLGVGERPLVTLVVTDSDQDTRRAVRALGEPSGYHHSAVATLGDVLDGGSGARVWQPGRYGLGSTPVVVPDFSLAALVDLAEREAQHPVHATLPMPHPDRLYAGDVRATPPAGEAFGDVLALQLKAVEKEALDLLAAWPLCTTEQLGGLMGGVSARRANQVLRPLRRRGLVQSDGNALVLTDEGLTCLARRDRAAVGPVLDRWTPQQDGGGVYIGSALRALASQREHQRGIAGFFDLLYSQVAYSPDYELLDLLPTHRSQISYRFRDKGYVIHPDASFQFGYRGEFRWCLLEYERRATTPKRVPERLYAYRRYFGSGYARPDHGGQLPLVLFAFDTEHAEEVFLNTAAGLPEVPLASTTTEALGWHGALGPIWRRPAPAAPERRSLDYLAWGDTLSDRAC